MRLKSSILLFIVGCFFCSPASAQKFDLLSGDFNDDGIVDLADYTLWRNNLGLQVSPFELADGDGDGTISIADYEVWKANYGSTAALESPQPYPTEAGAVSTVNVPEPTSVALLGIGILITLRRYLREQR